MQQPRLYLLQVFHYNNIKFIDTDVTFSIIYILLEGRSYNFLLLPILDPPHILWLNKNNFWSGI